VHLTTVGGFGRPDLLGGQANTAGVVARLGGAHVISGAAGLLASSKAEGTGLTWLAGVGIGTSPGHKGARRANCSSGQPAAAAEQVALSNQ